MAETKLVESPEIVRKALPRPGGLRLRLDRVAPYGIAAALGALALTASLLLVLGAAASDEQRLGPLSLPVAGSALGAVAAIVLALLAALYRRAGREQPPAGASARSASGAETRRPAMEPPGENERWARERRRLELALRESEQRFRDIADISGDWMWETDAEHRFTFFAGDALQRMELEGTHSADFYGKTRWEVAGITPADDPRWVAHCADLEAHRPFRNFRYSAPNPRGGHRHLVVSGLPIFDEHGTFRGYRGISTDETAFVQAMQRAEAADRLLRDAIESISEGFIIFDAEDRFVMCNEVFRRLHAGTPEELVPGRTFEELLRLGLARGLYPDARGREAEWLEERMRRHRELDGSLEYESATGRWALITERRMRNGGTAGLRVDITRLKQAQAALSESEQRFRDIAEVSGDWIWETDAQHRFTLFAGAGLQMPDSQGASAEVLGRTRWEVAGADPETDPFWRAHLEDLEQRLPIRNFRWSRRRPSGGVRHLVVNGKPVFDAEGVFRGYRGTSSDETAIVAALTRAEQAEALLSDAIDSISEGFVIFDHEDRVVMFNEAYRRYFPDFAVLGLRYEDAFRAAFDAGDYGNLGVEKEAYIRRRMQMHLDPQQPREICNQGRWFLISERRMRNGGIAGLRIDIGGMKAAQAALSASEAELRKSREHLAQAQRIAGVGSAEIDFRTDTVTWSDEAFRILGFEPGSVQPSTELFRSLVHEEDRARLVEQRAQLRQGKEPHPIEIRIRRAGGELRTLWREDALRRDESGAIVGGVVTLRDVTELRAVERRRNELEAQLMHSQRLESLGTLAGGIAHDLNNTMVPVVALSKLLLQQAPPGSDDRSSLELIHQAGIRSRELVKRILAFSRKEESEKHRLDLDRLIAASLPLIRATLPATIRIEYAAEARLPPVLCDPHQINLVLVNLLTNAAHAIGNNTGLITLELSAFAETSNPLPRQPPLHRGLCLSVRDTGCGIDPVTIPRIFEPFFTTKAVGEGTGLGLAVAHGIIASHGGRITVESERGRGTLFRVVLPAAEDE